MNTTKKLLSLLAMVAITLSCTTTKPSDEPTTPEPPIPPTEETAYPKDAKPTQFTDFFKRTMFVQHTGTSCGWCPGAIILINKIAESEDSDRIIPIAAHTFQNNDPMDNSFASKYTKECNVTGYPTVNLDLRTSANAIFDHGTPMASVIKKYNDLETKYPAKVAISASVSIVDNQFIVNTGVKIGVAGKYNIGIIVLEDNITATQANNGYKGYNFNIHKHAIRGGQPSSSVTGNPIQGGIIDAGQLIEKTFTVPLPAKTKIENASIVVYVSCPDTPDGTKYYINNAVVCKPGSPVPFKYKE